MALTTGTRAPEVGFTRADGTRVGLEELKAGGPVLLAFYKVSCPTCQLALPFLERLRGAGMGVYFVSQNPPAKAASFDQDFGTRTELFDTEDDGYAASNAFDLTHVPTLYVVEPEGEISFSSVGFFRSELAELGARVGREIFRAGERVPEAKSG